MRRRTKGITPREKVDGVVVHDARIRINGRQVTRTFPTAAQAGKWLASVEAAAHPVDPREGRQRFGAFVVAYFARRQLEDSTRALYRGLHANHLAATFDNVALAKITPQMVADWHADNRAQAGATVTAKAYRLLRAVMNEAVAFDVIERNPCRVRNGGVEPASERDHVPPAVLVAIAERIDPRLRALVLTAAFCGLRRAELLGLRRVHLDLAAGRLRITTARLQVDGRRVEKAPKSHAGRRDVPLPAIVAEALADHLAAGYAQAGPDGFVFTGAKGGPLSPGWLRTSWQRALTALGLPSTLRLHDCRHTAGTQLAVLGATTREVMAALGHSSMAAAIRYQHAADERRGELAALVDAAAREAPPWVPPTRVTAKSVR